MASSSFVFLNFSLMKIQWKTENIVDTELGLGVVNNLAGWDCRVTQIDARNWYVTLMKPSIALKCHTQLSSLQFMSHVSALIWKRTLGPYLDFLAICVLCIYLLFMYTSIENGKEQREL